MTYTLGDVIDEAASIQNQFGEDAIACVFMNPMDAKRFSLGDVLFPKIRSTEPKFVSELGGLDVESTEVLLNTFDVVVDHRIPEGRFQVMTKTEKFVLEKYDWLLKGVIDDAIHRRMRELHLREIERRSA